MGQRRRRLDAELVRRGLAADRDQARRVIAAGRVIVDGAPADKPARQVLPSAALDVLDPPPPFVSRGGGKLDHALTAFGIEVEARRCLDAGVSTGGFTDCLLQRGAAHVTGVDVGYGQVAEAVRTDPRVEVRERTNVRDLAPQDVDGPFDLVVCDVSFIALRTVLPVLAAMTAPDGDVVALVKPQFEAARDEVGDGGVVRAPRVWQRVLTQVVQAASELGWPVVDVTASPLPGPAGNVEFLVHARQADVGTPEDPDEVADRVAAAVDVGRGLAEQAGVALEDGS